MLMAFGARHRAVLAASFAAVAVSACGATTDGTPNTAAPPPKPAQHSTSTAPVEPVAEPGRPARPPSTPCMSNQRHKWVFVSLRRQHMWMCARQHVAYSTAITSGMVGPYTHTPTGSYHVQGLNRNSTLTLNTGATYQVKYWIPFNAPLFGFHDSSWQHFPYGSPKYRTHGSHGCIHMPLRAIRFFYDWANIGTPLRING
jgi:lipoprotein-anchoring transpeptidase ErfK/SrfK